MDSWVTLLRVHPCPGWCGVPSAGWVPVASPAARMPCRLRGEVKQRSPKQRRRHAARLEKGTAPSRVSRRTLQATSYSRWQQNCSLQTGQGLCSPSDDAVGALQNNKRQCPSSSMAIGSQSRTVLFSSSSRSHQAACTPPVIGALTGPTRPALGPGTRLLARRWTRTPASNLIE